MVVQVCILVHGLFCLPGFHFYVGGCAFNFAMLLPRRSALLRSFSGKLGITLVVTMRKSDRSKKRSPDLINQFSNSGTIVQTRGDLILIL